MTDHRLVRQAQLITPDLQRATVVIVGLGMLGSWLATGFARCAKRVIGIDFDNVARENLGTQLYTTDQIGRPKAYATEALLLGLPFEPHLTHFDSEFVHAVDSSEPLVVVSAVDSFAARLVVANWAYLHKAALFVDTRAHGTVGVVAVTRTDVLSMLHYWDTLESDESAPRALCGAEGAIFTGLWVAQQVIASVNRFLRGLPVDYKVVYDVGMGALVSKEAMPVQ